jgi:hypothetical protein
MTPAAVSPEAASRPLRRATTLPLALPLSLAVPVWRRGSGTQAGIMNPTFMLTILVRVRQNCRLGVRFASGSERMFPGRDRETASAVPPTNFGGCELFPDKWNLK